jgi:DnaJ-class molecular chaperone
MATKVKCPTCHGAGEVECPECDGTGFISDVETIECSRCNGTGQVKPNIFKSTLTATKTAATTDVTAVYINREASEVTSTITASLEGHSITSEEIVFAPNEEVTVALSIPFTSYYGEIGRAHV